MEKVGRAKAPTEVITIKEAVERYHCSRDTLDRRIKAGEIRAFKPGNKTLIDRKSGDEWFYSTQIQPRKRPGRPRKIHRHKV